MPPTRQSTRRRPHQPPSRYVTEDFRPATRRPGWRRLWIQNRPIFRYMRRPPQPPARWMIPQEVWDAISEDEDDDSSSSSDDSSSDDSPPSQIKQGDLEGWLNIYRPNLPKMNRRKPTKCAVCLENFSHLGGIKGLYPFGSCGQHLFCGPCILHWAERCQKKVQNITCPICREPL